MSLQNRVINFLALVQECLVIITQACLLAVFPILPSFEIQSSIISSVDGVGIEVCGW